jgi:hypothetical protein
MGCCFLCMRCAHLILQFLTGHFVVGRLLDFEFNSCSSSHCGSFVVCCLLDLVVLWCATFVTVLHVGRLLDFEVFWRVL